MVRTLAYRLSRSTSLRNIWATGSPLAKMLKFQFVVQRVRQQQENIIDCHQALIWRMSDPSFLTKLSLKHLPNMWLGMIRCVLISACKGESHSDYQAINCVESPRLRKVFLLLRESLREKDIPGRTAIRDHIDKMQKSHLETLSKELKVRTHNV
jgi:hypothetical protein